MNQTLLWNLQMAKLKAEEWFLNEYIPNALYNQNHKRLAWY
jgi:hypothetical protein